MDYFRNTTTGLVETVEYHGLLQEYQTVECRTTTTGLGETVEYHGLLHGIPETVEYHGLREYH